MYTFWEQAIEEDFEPFRLIRQTERGRVEIIRHRESGRKYILRRFTGSGEAYEKLKSIRCDNLPIIYDCAQKEDQVLVLEEYILGDTLEDLLSCGPLEKAQVKGISKQLCNALWVLHQNGLVHRDIKPANIMIRGDEAVLVDFDVTRKYSENKNSDTQLMGTVGYAPPEQYGLSQTDPRSDIYSLGVLMNIMLTGEHPSVKMARGKMGMIISRCTMTSAKQRFKSVLLIRDLL